MVQLATLVAFAAASAHEARSASAHIETPGGRQHYVHDESRCVVCVAHQQGSMAARAVGTPAMRVEASCPPVDPRTRVVSAVRLTAAVPPAPPVASSL
jgi:hypothetical protein